MCYLSKKEELVINNLRIKKFLYYIVIISLTIISFLYLSVTSESFKKVDAISRDEIELIPGGEAIGINIDTGVYVAGLYSIRGSGSYHSPAKNAGLKTGDIILEVNEGSVSSIKDVKQSINKIKMHKANYFTIKYSRNNNISVTKIYPVRKNNRISTGMYLKDKIIGVGTLTFVLPSENKFGALGHEIGGGNNKKVLNGSITEASITSLKKGSRGNPGEKHAEINLDKELGSIKSNKTTGIYGEYTKELNKERLKIASQDEVTLGDAWIYTVIQNQKVEKFKIKITDLKKQTSNDIKGIKVEIVDKELLDKTGGIIQGMSGSPIIQNNKIVGAITHVLLEDSAQGYGVYIDWMLEDLGIIID